MCAATTLCWQRVEAEEEAREQTEAEREIVEALKRLGKAKAATIATAMGSNRGNTSSRLQEMWKAGKIHMEVIGYVPHYFLKEQKGPNSQDEPITQTGLFG